MSALYSIIVVVIVALLLLINSLWLYESADAACNNCDIPHVQLENLE